MLGLATTASAAGVSSTASRQIFSSLAKKVQRTCNNVFNTAAGNLDSDNLHSTAR